MSIEVSNQFKTWMGVEAREKEPEASMAQGVFVNNRQKTGLRTGKGYSLDFCSASKVEKR